jgi:hypothetical protein
MLFEGFGDRLFNAGVNLPIKFFALYSSWRYRGASILLLILPLNLSFFTAMVCT